MTEQLATLRADDEQVGLRFERHYDATPDEVWAALTEPESIRRWLLAEAVLEPRVGGVFALDWSADDRADGRVRVWDPPLALEVDWIEPSVQSVLRIELSAAESGTMLVLDHRNVASDAAVGMGAGWHAHLEALGELLEGGDPDADGVERRFESLRSEYALLLPR
jgi:uncharacterized protein YndB with AHSA1/START domain